MRSQQNNLSSNSLASPRHYGECAHRNLHCLSRLRKGVRLQLEGNVTYAAATELEILKEFRERAIPGKTEWEARPAWVEMMLALAAANVKTIVVESLNRLARDLMVQEHIIADLRQRGVTLISVQEPDLCIDDPSRKLLRQIMGAIAEYDRAMIVLKLRSARNRIKAATGRCEGRKPYGARPGEARTLERILTLRRQGLTLEVIAYALNEDGLRTRYKKPWRIETLSKIIKRYRIPNVKHEQ
jgi:DNA invertase Pin-like site-specific DNA recombinase